MSFSCRFYPKRLTILLHSHTVRRRSYREQFRVKCLLKDTSTRVGIEPPTPWLKDGYRCLSPNSRWTHGVSLLTGALTTRILQTQNWVLNKVSVLWCQCLRDGVPAVALQNKSSTLSIIERPYRACNLVLKSCGVVITRDDKRDDAHLSAVSYRLHFIVILKRYSRVNWSHNKLNVAQI